MDKVILQIIKGNLKNLKLEVKQFDGENLIIKTNHNKNSNFPFVIRIFL